MIDSPFTLIKYDNIEGGRPFTLIRHELRVGDEDELIKSYAAELEIDQSLGLQKQAEITMIKALEHDIDQLTSSRDYFEVSQKLLRRIFKIESLQRMCFWNNIISSIRGFIICGFLPLFFHAIMLISIYPMLKFSMWVWPITIKNSTALLVTAVVFNVLLWIGEIILLIAGFANWEHRRIKYATMEVDMVMEPLKSVTEKIPLGAKLKVLEASKTGIFQDFVYVTPKFEVKDNEHEVRFPAIDPAILGVTSDKRMYMIVYWDIDKDIAKVIKKIEHFKKFKLNKGI